MDIEVASLVEQIDAELQAAGNASRATTQKAYLKSELGHYGAAVPQIRATATAASRRHLHLTHSQLIALVDALWDDPVHERRLACVELLTLFGNLLGPSDLAGLERHLRESRTWALVDPLAVNVIGKLVEQHAEATSALDRWAADGDFWMRRSAMLALLVPLRRGAGDFARFSRYADSMLGEREFFIRKAIGWILRDTGRKRPDLVFDWLLPRASRASGVTLREVAKVLSPTQRDAIAAAR